MVVVAVRRNTLSVRFIVVYGYGICYYRSYGCNGGGSSASFSYMFGYLSRYSVVSYTVVSRVYFIEAGNFRRYLSGIFLRDVGACVGAAFFYLVRAGITSVYSRCLYNTRSFYYLYGRIASQSYAGGYGVRSLCVSCLLRSVRYGYRELSRNSFFVERVFQGQYCFENVCYGVF